MRKIFLILILIFSLSYGQNKVQKIGEVGDTLDVTNTKIKYSTKEISAFLGKITASSQLQTAGIENNAITVDKLGNSAVTTDKIYYGAVDGLRIATNAVSTTHILAQSVTSAKFKFDDGPIIDVVDNGVTNDSVDCTTTLQGLLDNADTGDHFYFPPGKYLVSTELTFTCAAGHDSVIMDFAPGAFWYPGDDGITINGAATGQTTTLASDICPNYEQITVTDASGFTRGNLLSFLSTASWPFGTGVREGEIHTYLGREGNIIRVQGHSWGEYDIPGETVTITEYKPVYFVIKGANIVFNDATYTKYGIRLYWGRNCRFENCKIYRAGYTGIEVRNSIGTEITGCEIGSSNQTGQGYGVAIVSSSNSDISHNKFYECRTACTASAGGTNYPSRNNSFYKNFVYGGGWLRSDSSNIWDNSGGQAAFDGHEGSEWNVFESNEIFGTYYGFKLRGLYNTCISNVASGYMYAYASVSYGTTLIFNNNIYSSRLQSKGGMTSPDEMTYQLLYGVIFGAGTTTGEKAYVEIKNNTFDGLLIAGIGVALNFENINAIGNTFVFNRTTGNNVRLITSSSGSAYTVSNSRFLDNIVHTISGTFSHTHPSLTLTNCVSTYTDYNSGQFYILGTLSPTVLNMPTLTL